MKESVLRKRISYIIIISEFVLFTILFLALLGALIPKHLMTLIGILAPIITVYLSALVNYGVENRYKKEEKNDKKVNPLYVTISYIFIPAHFLSILFLVVIYALFVPFSFETLKVFFTIIEVFFGAYVGLIVSSLYKTEGKI